jgi:hypothetical protein
VSDAILIRIVRLGGDGFLTIYDKPEGRSAIYWSPSPTRADAGLRSRIYLGTALTSQLASSVSGRARPAGRSVSSPLPNPYEQSLGDASLNVEPGGWSFLDQWVARARNRPGR